MVVAANSKIPKPLNPTRYARPLLSPTHEYIFSRLRTRIIINALYEVKMKRSRRRERFRLKNDTDKKNPHAAERRRQFINSDVRRRLKVESKKLIGIRRGDALLPRKYSFVY